MPRAGVAGDQRWGLLRTPPPGQERTRAAASAPDRKPSATQHGWRGGEKQRLSIARAMMKESKIILLDEATSSLDSETESKIQDALKILTKDKTTIVIAHRLSTILNSNNIYLIDEGNIIDSGKHNELIQKSELYKSFYERQIQK